MFNQFGQWSPNQMQGQVQPNQMQAQPMNQQAPPNHMFGSQMQAQPQMQQAQPMMNQQMSGSAYQTPGQSQGMFQPVQQFPGMFQPQQMPGDSSSPQATSNYLQFLQQSGAGNAFGNNSMMNQHWGAQQSNPQNQNFQGFQGFQGGTLNNLSAPPNPNGYNQANYNPLMTGQQSQGGVSGLPNTGGMPSWQGPNFASFSDKNAKTNVKSAEDEMDSFFSSLGIYSYEYKDKKDGEGRRISPMAQEMAKSPLGQVAISKDERGLMKVDYGKLMGTMLAGIAMDHQKIKELEERIKKSMELKTKKDK